MIVLRRYSLLKSSTLLPNMRATVEGVIGYYLKFQSVSPYHLSSDVGSWESPFLTQKVSTFNQKAAVSKSIDEHHSFLLLFETYFGAK